MLMRRINTYLCQQEVLLACLFFLKVLLQTNLEHIKSKNIKKYNNQLLEQTITTAKEFTIVNLMMYLI